MKVKFSAEIDVDHLYSPENGIVDRVALAAALNEAARRHWYGMGITVLTWKIVDPEPSTEVVADQKSV